MREEMEEDTQPGAKDTRDETTLILLRLHPLRSLCLWKDQKRNAEKRVLGDSEVTSDSIVSKNITLGETKASLR